MSAIKSIVQRSSRLGSNASDSQEGDQDNSEGFQNPEMMIQKVYHAEGKDNQDETKASNLL